eukprot:CAMPEP_0206442610 /NCGR_PEP_ID=MMETSP0324_2-20121206/13915_1 /ASSEMBLY_ACC=CAM_ASM_000836 /TAXON_ID=2866 /ORGANISM="Crypthecodinium cohnii, Strain Seligo" /LENGTH=71 /DNA_ID=CAMNT_0053910467 /DNA_START=106 /DNA_END=321 /DNA_ORIENTATION=+
MTHKACCSSQASTTCPDNNSIIAVVEDFIATDLGGGDRSDSADGRSGAALEGSTEAGQHPANVKVTSPNQN